MMMNVYPITAFPDKEVYQYEVSTCSLQIYIELADNYDQINILHGTVNETDRRILRKCWNSETRKERIPDGIWDGGRICW